MAVPKLSTSDGTILTVTRPPDTGTGATDAVRYESTVISADDGTVLAARELPAGTPDPLQLAGTTAPGRVLYQGTLGRILRITAVPDN
ncbi:MAG: hypothetical protein R2716_13655 [Microthrixaceae bacterium]